MLKAPGMTSEEAHALLDAARAGDPSVSARMIDEALKATGDVEDGEPIQVWRAADDWGSTDFGRLPAGPFDGLMQ